MLLSDGRRVGCLEVGKPDGFPVFHFHGNGSSRWEVMLLADAATSAGVRLIGMDRPGIGNSDPAPGRALADWPDDVAQVADRLGIERFAVEGFSAGGAYALACAHRIADRLTGCGLISSICPPELVRQAAPGWMRAGWWIGARRPQLLLHVLRTLMPDSLSDESGAEERLRRIGSWLARADRQVLGRPQVRKPLLRAMMESRRQGAQASRREIATLLRGWNVPIEQIALRNVFMWHGEDDRITPIGPARLLAARLPHGSATFYPGEGHFSILANHARHVFAEQLACARR